MFDFIKRSVVARVIDEDITGGYVVAIYSKYFRYHLDTIVVHGYEDALEVQNRKHFIERVEQKLSRIDNGRALALRQLPQIMIMQSANNTEIDTIKDVVDVAVPLWKSQLNLYISQLKTKNAVETRQSVTSVINETIQQNAVLMNQNVTDIAAGYSTDIISIDTIKVVNDNLLSSINTMAECQKNAQQKRIESFNNIKAMDNELKQIQLKN